MFFYFLLIRIVAFFGHPKARQLVEGQKKIVIADNKITFDGRQIPHGAIWVHAASVGEFEQARTIIEKLKVESGKWKVVVTFFSPSGYEMRKNYDKADAVLYLPFATRANAREFISALRPKMAIFVKYEFWPAYLQELKAQGIPTYSICAIFRESQPFFQWWGKSLRKVLHCFTHIFVQDEASRELLARFGIENASVAGDTRFDRVAAVSGERLAVSGDRFAPIEQFVGECKQVLVAGSTWHQDEELLARYIEEHPECKLLLVPHEIDEAHIHTIFNAFQGRYARYTRATDVAMRNAQVLVIDTMGLLSSIYRFGQVAYIGGGFGVGIHNTIEAAVYGVPVIFGPKYEHFREAKGLIAAGAARSVKNYAELEAAIDTAFEQHEAIGQKAANYVASELGATTKIYEQIFGL